MYFLKIDYKNQIWFNSLGLRYKPNSAVKGKDCSEIMVAIIKSLKGHGLIGNSP